MFVRRLKWRMRGEATYLELVLAGLGLWRWVEKVDCENL